MPRQTHRELYPEQYTHPACGTQRQRPDGDVGTVWRVFGTRFGQLAMFEDDGDVAYRLSECPEVVSHA